MSHEIATVKRMPTLEENISLRTITYVLYVNGKHEKTYTDVLRATAARDAINKSFATYCATRKPRS